ncbi:MAG: energy transducer TonB [Candidatus Sulfotelmatobacter sp.]
MFAESMLETSWAQRTRRNWTKFTSFGVQALVIGLVLLLPLLKTVGLPSGRVLPTPISWGTPPPSGPRVERQNTTTIVQSNLADNVLIAPRGVPAHVAQIEETIAPPQMSFNTPGVLGATGGGSGDGIWKSLDDSLSHVAPLPAPAPASTVRPFRTSNILAGSLVNRVQPEYPYAAKMAHVQGQVVLYAIISREGTIENLHVVTGHPLLVRAAIEAVSRWRYRPYILNGEPVEVETQIMVNFTLGGG